MKKLKIISIIVAATLIVAAILAGCGNQQFFDTTYTFDLAIISLPNGTIVEGNVQSWKDYEDGDQIQVVIDGKTYLTHTTNVVLIAE